MPRKSLQQVAPATTGDDRRLRSNLIQQGLGLGEVALRRRPDQEWKGTSCLFFIDGVLHRTPFVSGATGVGIHLGGAELVLGDHPLARELGSLGLPKGALMSVWMEHSRGRFEAPAPC